MDGPRIASSHRPLTEMATFTWILYPPHEATKLSPGDCVFIRTSSQKEIGRKGHVVESESENQKKEEDRVSVRIPITGKSNPAGNSPDDQDFYTASFRPIRLIPVLSGRTIDNDSPNKCTIIVTETTNKYRLLAASQLKPTDHVLEIGCSNGECSLVISKYVQEGSLVGFDISQKMIAEAESKMKSGCTGKGHGHVQFHVIDPFTNPKQALLLATGKESSSVAEGNTNTEEGKDKPLRPSVVFIDIGGNRDLNSVIQMLAWVRQCFSPRLCIIKSEEMVESIIGDEAANTSATVSEEPESKRLKTNAIKIEPCGLIRNGEDWFNAKLEDGSKTSNLGETNSKPRFSHPKKAPLSVSPEDGKTPICRYYNYHKNGCHQDDCPLDHKYCHWCLKQGHIALHCTNL